MTLKELGTYSLPLILSSLLEPVAGVVDTAFIGQLGSKELAAFAIAITILNSFTWMFNFVIYASTQGISDAVGLSDTKEVSQRVRISMTVALLVGVLSVFSVYILLNPLFTLAGGSEPLQKLFNDYFLIRLGFQPIAILYTASLGIMRGLGQVRENFISMIISTSSNIAITYSLMFVFQMGVSAAAWGTGLAYTVSFIFSLYCILKSPDFKLDLAFVKSEKSQWLSFGKNSWHLFGRSFLLSSSFFISTKFASTLGIKTLAAHQIILQFWLFSAFFIDGIAHAANILCARLKAKEQTLQLRNLVIQFFKLGAVVGFIFTVFYFFMNEFLIKRFSNDIEVVAIINQLWPLVCFAQIINALSFVADGVLFGLGGFKFLRNHMIVAVFLLFLPVASIVFYDNKLIYIWLGAFAIVLYRLFSSLYFLKKELQ